MTTRTLTDDARDILGDLERLEADGGAVVTRKPGHPLPIQVYFDGKLSGMFLTLQDAVDWAYSKEPK